MSWTASDIDAAAARALDLVERAFAHRMPPAEMSDSKQLSDVEYEEVMSFEGLTWREVTFRHVEQACDAVFWFSPEAFCYYLPGVLSAGLREGSTGLNYFDSLIGCLDRSPMPEYWDDFFLPRFTLLTTQEIDALSAWVDWMELCEPDGFMPYTYGRVRETLALLRERAPRD